MARHWTPIDDIVNDYMILMDDDDYGATRNSAKVRKLAISALKHLRQGGLKTIQGAILTVDKNTNSVELPNDFIDYARIGVISTNGTFIPLKINKTLMRNKFAPLLNNLGEKIVNEDGIELTALRQYGSEPKYDTTVRYLSSPFYAGTPNFGLGGGNSIAGECVVDLDNDRIFFSTTMTSPEICLEYIADESMSSRPRVHEYAEEAVMAYIYYGLIKRKVGVPENAKERALRDYKKEKILAIKNTTQDKSVAEIIMRLSKHTQASPRTGGKIYN